MSSSIGLDSLFEHGIRLLSEALPLSIHKIHQSIWSLHPPCREQLVSGDLGGSAQVLIFDE